jgi:hypothetical protein
VPSDSMERVEDVHLVLDHMICSTIREFQRQQLGLILRLRPEVAANLDSDRSEKPVTADVSR